MEKSEYKAKGKEEKKAEARHAPGLGGVCPACGEAFDPGDLFCAECGAPLPQGGAPGVEEQGKEVAHEVRTDSVRLHGTRCPHCGATISETCELCPKCGKPIDPTICSFCGTSFEGDELFCSECGSPRGGIRCPKCRTVSYRSFCTHCNTPLNDRAREAVAAASSDPRYQKALRLSEEMREMEEYLLEMKDAVGKAIADEETAVADPGTPELSAEGQRLRQQHAELLALLGQNLTRQQQTKPRAVQEQKKNLQVRFADADQIMEAYRQKAAEMQAALRDLTPDAGMTPHEQRDYACGRKVPTVVMEMGERPTKWECNYCHYLHNQPGECAEPWHGGVWHTEPVMVEKKIWTYLT